MAFVLRIRGLYERPYLIGPVVFLPVASAGLVLSVGS